MADSPIFNMADFLREYKSYNTRKFTATENAQAAMEQRDIARAQEAVAGQGFLGLTLSEKLAELGIGERVIQQLGDTAVGAVAGIFTPFTDWLKEFEKVLDQDWYNAELQAYGKQLFFANFSLSQATEEDKNGQTLNILN